MNLPATESIGRASLLDLLAPPAAEQHGNAAHGPSFDTLLSEQPRPPAPRPPDQPAAPTARSRDSQPSSSSSNEPAAEATDEAPEANSEEKPPVAEVPDEDEDQPADEPAEQAVVLVVPVVLLEAVPVTEASDEPVAVIAPEKIAAAEQPTTAADASLDLSAPVATAEGQPEDEPATDGRAAAIAAAATEAASEVVLPVPAVTQEQSKSDEPAESLELPADEEQLAAVEGLPPAAPVKKRLGSGTGEEIETGRESATQTKDTSEQSASDQLLADASQVGPAGEIGAATGPAAAAPVDAPQAQTNASNSAPAAVQGSGPRLSPELLAAAGSRPSREGDGSRVDSARLLTRVARAFVAAQDGNGEVTLRLSPAELGSLRLEIRVRDGVLVARLETETNAARTAIIDNLPALRERLAEQGVRIERFDVDLMQQQGSGTPDRPAERQPSDQPRPDSVPRPRRLPQVAEGVVARSAVGEPDLRGLNVIV